MHSALTPLSPLDGMINIPIYLVWGCWVQLNSIFFADHIIFNNGHMKHTHSWQRMTNNNNKNKKKKKTSLIPPTIPVCFPTQKPLF